MGNIVLLRAASILIARTCPVAAYPQSDPVKPSAELVYMDQGWSENNQTRFHTASQGSQLMPYGWLIALEKPASEAMFLTTNQGYGMGEVRMNYRLVSSVITMRSDGLELAWPTPHATQTK